MNDLAARLLKVESRLFTSPSSVGNLALTFSDKGEEQATATPLRLVETGAASRPIFGAWERAERRRNLSARTINEHRSTLERLSTWADQLGIPVLELDAEDIETWLDSCRIGASSRRTYLGAIRAFYSWCLDAGHVNQDPTDIIGKPRVARPLPRPIATNDLAKAMANSEGRMRVWLCLGAYQGLRCIEMAGLERPDILDTEAEQQLVVRHGKGRKHRVLPLHPETLAAVEAADLPIRGPMFRIRDGVPIREAVVSAYIARYLHGLGIDASAHQLRHWFGTRLYESTRDLLLVREMMGHESIQTTSIYTKLVASGHAVDAVRGLKI